MIPRSSMAPVIASGAANVVKLLVATLAFTGAYVGVEASQNASVRARLGVDAGAPVRTVALSAESLPAVTRSDLAGSPTGAAAAENIPAVGTVTVSAVTALGACDKPYRIQSVIGNAHPEKAVSYGWGLQRWSPSTRNWRPYLSMHSGFIGKSQTVKWEPRVVNNPGWYRAVLSVSGDAPLHGKKFLVSC